jgi:folate-binding protein YgfZ
MTVDVAAALLAASSAALVVPSADLATLVVTGADRRTWLNGLVTCDLAPRKDGEALYGLFTAQKGRVLSDAIFLLDGERILVAVPRLVLGELRASLDHYLIMEDAEATEGAFDVALLHGPRATEVLSAMQDAGARGALLDTTGLGGAIVFVDSAARAAVVAARDVALAAAGGALGDEASWEALRIARRVPRFGVDFDAATYPQEAGLEKRAISFNKGCYLGQEVVCMLELRGHVKRKLVGLRLGGPSAPARGADVTDAGGESVGAVTSAAVVPGEGVLALAMVKRAKAEPGAALRVGGTDAVVVGPAA